MKILNAITRLKLGMAFSAMIFWIPIFTLFFQNRGFALSDVYFLVTTLSIAVVIFEYPTGVIGDHFSHKLSVQLGYMIVAIATLLSLLFIPRFYYFLIVILQALGLSLASGSDIAFLHSVSSDFKKDVADVKALGLVAILTGTIIGGFVGKFNTDIPITLTAVTSMLGFVLISTVPTIKKVESEESNIFSRAKEGLSFVKRSDSVLHTLLLGAVFGAFLFSLKWFYNTIFLDHGVEQSLWGVFASISMFCTAIGAIIYRKKIALNIGLIVTALITSIFLMGFLETAVITIFALFLYSLFQGFFEVEYEQLLNKQVPDSIRASVLSLKSLVLRIVYAIYTLGAGVLLKTMNLSEFLILTSLVLLAISIPLWKRIRSTATKHTFK